MYKIFGDNNVNSTTFTPITIYDPERFADGYTAASLSMSKELSKAGSLSFTISPDNPSYDDITPLKTTISVLSDGELIWYGRVISVSDDLYKQRVVNCEDALAFLSDILIKPFKYRYGVSYAGSTVSNHISTILSLYSARASKKRLFSSFGGVLPSEFENLNTYSVKGVDSFTTVWDELTGICEYGDNVYITLNYISGTGLPRLVVGQMPYGSTTGSVAIGTNLVNITRGADFTEMYTSLIPVDDNNKTLSGNQYRVDSGLVSEYGVIERTLSVGSVSDPTLVRNFCSNVLTAHARMIIPELSVGALDMFYLNDNVIAIDPGLTVRIVSAPHNIDAYYTCTRTQVDLENPENATYSFKYYGGDPYE